MKQFLLLLSASLITASASANEIRQVMQTRSDVQSNILQHRSCAAALSSESGAIIATPAGQLTDNMTLSEFAVYPRGFEIYQRMVSGKVSAIVEGEDGCLYVKNPIGTYDTDSWLKLEHREGNVYVAKLPQPATESWDYEGETIWMNFDRLEFDEDEGYYYPSFTESELTFSYENGTLTSIGEIGEDVEMPVMLGLTYNLYGPEDADEAWAWFGVNNITVKAMDAVPGALPEGLTGEKKLMASSVGDSHVWVAVNGEDIYLRPGADFGYISGKITDGKAVFESNQYLGVLGNSHCYFLGGESEFIEDDDYYEGGYTTYYPADDLSFDYLTDGSLLKSDGALIINEGNLSFYAKNIYDKPVISDYKSVDAAPENPIIVRYEPYDDFDEYGVFIFDLPNKSTTGETISKVDMYYNIFADGSDEPYVFTPAMYELIGSPMTNIPYGFTDGGYDFSVNGTRHTVVLYEEIEVVGVQSVNVAGENEYKSQIVWSDGALSGIESVTVTPACESEFYDLTGRRVNQPSTGIYIRRQGNITDKVVIK